MVAATVLKTVDESRPGSSPGVRIMLYQDYKIYGPYLCSDQRRRIILYKNQQNRITISYARYLMEIHLGYYLSEDVEVHHKDENPLNDVIDNYEIVNTNIHKKYHVKFELFICHWCEKVIELSGIKLSRHKSNSISRNGSGPFCNRRCAGKYNQQFTPRK